ncbi:hypothetical protein AB0H71_33630 [Nocardia sp. NPDC050697]|uniref:hypothetical protein n=1 Tax=Nocardia sp. NPDC050697 TaxID=3155158 RepID=UPI0033FB2AC6
MKLLHQAPPDVTLRVENTALRRENTRLQDELTSARSELAAARAELRAGWADMDDLLDLASSYALAAPAERLGIARVWERWACPDTRPLTTAQARTVMQQHRGCLTGECRVRATAVRVLRDSGHLVPDSGRRSPIS